MILEVLKLIEKKNYSKNMLLEKLSLTKNELDILLEELTKERKIYLNEKNKYSIIRKDQVIGRIESNSKGEKFIKNQREKIHIKPEDLHTALKNDLVVCDIYDNNYGKVVGILERKNNRLVCEVISKKGKLMLTPFNVGCEVSLLLSDKKILKNFVPGDRVVVTLENTVNDTNSVLVYDAIKIGHKDEPRSDELAIAISKDFDIDFSKEAIKETLDIPNEVRNEDKIGRTDLTKEKIFTIDSIHTKDMDDAVRIKGLYNGNYLLGVHIADVSYYVKPGSALFNEAEKRATSLYLGDSVIPMLPPKLSNGICSLNEGVERLTKTCYMEINRQGHVVNYKIIDSVIKSQKKMSYEELNQFFNGEEVDDSYAPFIYDLLLMRDLSEILYRAKQRRGNIEFESNEVKVTNNEEEMPIEFSARKNGEAERIIENFMVLTNETIASYFYWQDLPFIYRVHNLPDEVRMEKTIELIQTIGPKLIKLQNAYGQKEIQNILDKYKGSPEYSIISNLLLKNMSKAMYSTQNIGHFALALDNYCHFTSPIRRFPDLAIHHLLNIFNKDYLKNNLPELEGRLEVISRHSSYKERQADDAEKDYLKLKMAKYMEEHIGEEFEGILIDIDKESITIKLANEIKGILAYTDDFCQSFYVDSYNKELKSNYSKTKFKLGTKVIVRVYEVNIPQKEIYFELISKSLELTRKKN